MREWFKWRGYVRGIKEDRLPKIVVFSQLCIAKRKAGRFQLGGRRKERLKENVSLLGECGEGGFE